MVSLDTWHRERVCSGHHHHHPPGQIWAPWAGGPLPGYHWISSWTGAFSTPRTCPTWRRMKHHCPLCRSSALAHWSLFWEQNRQWSGWLCWCWCYNSWVFMCVECWYLLCQQSRCCIGAKDRRVQAIKSSVITSASGSQNVHINSESEVKVPATFPGWWGSTMRKSEVICVLISIEFLCPFRNATSENVLNHKVRSNFYSSRVWFLHRIPSL